ncbi:MAG: DUF6602 domain-containing protein [Pirellulales bacterium]
MMTERTPNIVDYHKSISDELNALKNRVRNLATHWPTDGEWKEAVLRTVIRRHLPPSMTVGRGFIVTRDKSSTQLDLMVIDARRPTLFRDGDLVIVTPDAVRAIVEVKTAINTTREFHECVAKLAATSEFNPDGYWGPPWRGLFVFEESLGCHEELLKCLYTVFEQTQVPVHAVSYGDSCFLRFFSDCEVEEGDDTTAELTERWRFYRIEHLAASYFIGNLIRGCCSLDGPISDEWFPMTAGKSGYQIDEIEFPSAFAREAEFQSRRCDH